MAKEFGKMANSRFWDALFPGSNDPLILSFGLDGKKGPRYIAALSGTTLTTGHLGYLALKWRKREVTEIKGRRTFPVNVSYLAMKPVDGTTGNLKLRPICSTLWGLIPIGVSFLACVICALIYDWFSLSMILAGIIAGGLTGVVIGEGRLVVNTVWLPAEGVPPGHGILIEDDRVMVIKGAERDVSVLTQGRFGLVKRSIKIDDDGEKDKASKHHAIGVCSLLLLVPVLLQLLLIPQGTFLGQLMFLVSLGVSWLYNFYLASLEREKIQGEMLYDMLGQPEMFQFCTGTRTTMAVFTCLLLLHKVKCTTEEEEHDARVKILDTCIPNDTAVWTLWKEKIVQHLLDIKETSNTLPSFVDDMQDQRLSKFSEMQRKLFQMLLDDALAAFEGYFNVRDRLPGDSSVTTVHS